MGCIVACRRVSGVLRATAGVQLHDACGRGEPRKQSWRQTELENKTNVVAHREGKRELEHEREHETDK